MAVRTLAQLKNLLTGLLVTGTTQRSAPIKSFIEDVLDSVALNVNIPETFTLTVGTADASGGSDGDVHLQYSGSNLVSIWHRASGSWNEYAVPSGGSGATVTASTSDASGGSDGDLHLQYTGSNLTSVWFRSSGTWNEYAVPSGGGTSIAKATNTQIDAVDSTDTALSGDLTATNDEDDTSYLTIRKFLRLLQRVLKTASTTLRGVVLLARNQDVDATLTDQARVPTVASAIRLINRIAAAAGSEPEEWSTIPANTAIALGKVVIHSGAYFGCIQAHNKRGSGPDGDPLYWTLLSNFRGAWSAGWYPVGSFVTHAGLPWIATQSVNNGDPAPNASTNTKWLSLGSVGTSVVVAASNTAIPASADGNTYLHTGSSNITYTLPAASGGSAVDDGWEIVISNQGAGDLTIDGNGAETINGRATLVLTDLGRTVRLQKVANGAWITIADTKDEQGSSGTSFSPTKANLYSAVKAIFSHNTAVTPDDANNELDVATGAAATIADNSIVPAKAQAGTAAQKKAWRARLSSSQISQVSAALPALANHNTNDFIIVGRGGDTVVTFVDLDDPSTQLTRTVAGDLLLLLSNRWTRVGNLFSGGIAAASAKAIAEANRDRLMVALTQGDFYGGSDEAIEGTYHLNVESMPGAFPTANKVEVWIGDPGISRVLSQTWVPAQTQRNLEFEISPSVADNLETNGLVTIGDELGVELRLIAPGDVELYRGGFDFPIIAAPPDPTGLNQAQVDARVNALRRNFREIAGSAGATRTWTYQLAATDQEIMIVLHSGNSNVNRRGFHSAIFPRALFGSSAGQFVVDSRVADAGSPDDKSGGVTATLNNAHLLTLSTVGWYNAQTAPRVFVK